MPYDIYPYTLHLQKINAKGFDIDYKALLGGDKKIFNEALTVAHKISVENFGKKIRFYTPSFVYYKTEYYCSSPNAFPSISVTGSSCALRCKHCGGIVLNTMYPATTPERLITLCKELKEKGAFTSRVACLASRSRLTLACFGRAVHFGASPARWWPKSLIQFRPGSTKIHSLNGFKATSKPRLHA